MKNLLVCLNICSQVSYGGEEGVHLMCKCIFPCCDDSCATTAWLVWGRDTWWDHDCRCSVHPKPSSFISDEPWWCQSQCCTVERPDQEAVPLLSPWALVQTCTELLQCARQWAVPICIILCSLPQRISNLLKSPGYTELKLKWTKAGISVQCKESQGSNQETHHVTPRTTH